jgi:hypothetical protein
MAKAKPEQTGSSSKEANGVTTALFVHMTPSERRSLERLARGKNMALAHVVRALIVEADLRLRGKWVDGQLVPLGPVRT